MKNLSDVSRSGSDEPSGSKSYLSTLHGKVSLPTFFPDGTQGVVKGVDSADLESVGVEGLVINTYHLYSNAVNTKIKKFSGIHQFMNWKRPIITDSGGFQVMSLIHDHPELGTIDDQKITFRLSPGEKIILTPEKSIQIQLELGCDIAIVLDDCTHPEAPLKEQEKSVERTITWAKRSKEEFSQGLASPGKATPLRNRPLLFAVVQGGNNLKPRKKCAQELIKIGFDGYCFGGFPVDKKGKFLTGLLDYVANLLPDDKPKYALGIGKPEDIVACVQMGYGIFDCVIPTREARHKKLYVFNQNPKTSKLIGNKFYSNINIGAGKWAQSKEKISKHCDCLTCRNYSRAYLHHLFKVGDTLAVRLATIHNLRFYSMLMEALK